MDLFERGDAQAVHHEYPRLLQLAARLSGVGYWRFVVADRKVYWSREVYRIHGVDPATFDPNLAAAVEFYHPDDRPVVTALLHRAICDGAGYKFQLRLVTAGEHVRDVICKAECDFAPDGAVAAVYGVFQDVTEQMVALREAQRARRESEELARRAALAEEMAGLGHWRFELPSRTLTWSPQMHVIYGVPASAPLDVDALLAMTHPEDRALREARQRDDLKGVKSEPLIFRIVRPDGAIRWVVGGDTRVERNAAGRAVAMVGTVMDITRQHEAERDIAASERRYRLLTENATDVVTQTDAQGVFTYVSPAVASVTGFTPEEMVGRQALDFIEPADRERVVSAFLEGRDRPRGWTIEYRVLCKQGPPIWVEARPSFARSIDGGGKVTDVIRDVTARKQLEAQLIAARAEAEAAAAAKSEFLANMSHEIRTPLTGMLGFAGLLEGLDGLPATARTYADRIVTSGRALLSVVNDILDFSKLEADRLDLDPHPFDPAALVTEMLDLVGSDTARKGLAVRNDVDGDLPAAVFADGARVRQVLLNLLTNAIKFTDTGALTVTTRYFAETGRLRVTVSDTGVGIPADRLDRLFQRFSQVDGSITRQYGGTGLGLAIARRLTERMGGEIGVESRPGVGSSFWFVIDAPAADRIAPAAPAPAAPHPGLAAGRILLVDDVAMNRELVRTMLAPFGFDLAEASGGAEAVAAALGEAFDLILMDLHMPGMDGYAATRAIRQTSQANRATPILALSANVLPEHHAACRAAGMNDHIAKPISPAELLTKIAHWCGAGREAAAA
jgi:PAS domain S-box-containing protein